MLRRKRAVLEHRLDAGIAGGERCPGADAAALDQDFALVGVMHTGKRLHQGGLARAVVAQKAQHLALADGQRHA
jgi:hypothetical protein